MLVARAVLADELELLEAERTALPLELLTALPLELLTALPLEEEEERTALPELLELLLTALPEELPERVALPEVELEFLTALPLLELLERVLWLVERLTWLEELLPELERVALPLLLEERVTWLLLREAELELEEEEERVALPELDRVLCPDVVREPLLERVWATILGAATRDRAISTVAAIVKIRLIASKF